MILEIAQFAVRPGTADEFAAAVQEALPLVRATEGLQTVRLVRGIESPDRFVLLIEWDTVEAHTEGFRQSDRYPRWRELISPYFDGDPTVEHYRDVPV